MEIQNCSCCYRNSCYGCPLNIWKDWTDWTWINIKSPELPTYNPETHELVEKKDYKIKELEKRIDSYKKGIDDYQEKISYYTKTIAGFNLEIDSLEKELKQLKGE